jgi:hypothetical protein
VANPYAGVYFGFKIWENLLRARMYAVNTAPTINISLSDMVGRYSGGPSYSQTRSHDHDL